MGHVYLAEHLGLLKACAVKVIRATGDGPEHRDEALARFFIEAAALGRMDHPNVLRALDFGHEREHDTWYLVTELLGGEDLLDRIGRVGVMRADAIVPIALELCAALGHAHERGVVHRDVKPENIRLIPSEGRGERVKLMDFGTARVLSGHASADRPDHVVIGTPAYMSPEQATGSEVDVRSDLYSLGVLLFEMATSQLPFHRRASAPMSPLERAEQPPLPSSIVADIDPALESVVLWCMRRDPRDRPASASAVADALGSIGKSARRSRPRLRPSPMRYEATRATDRRDTSASEPVTIERQPDDRWNVERVRRSIGAILTVVAIIAGLHILHELGESSRRSSAAESSRQARPPSGR